MKVYTVLIEVAVPVSTIGKSFAREDAYAKLEAKLKDTDISVVHADDNPVLDGV